MNRDQKDTSISKTMSQNPLILTFVTFIPDTTAGLQSIHEQQIFCNVLYNGCVIMAFSVTSTNYMNLKFAFVLHLLQIEIKATMSYYTLWFILLTAVLVAVFKFSSYFTFCFFP